MRTHDRALGFCTVCGARDAKAGSSCLVMRLPSVAEKMERAASMRLHLDVAREIDDGETELGAAVRAHLLTMGWRAP
jgi:hypothetical protein